MMYRLTASNMTETIDLGAYEDLEVLGMVITNNIIDDQERGVQYRYSINPVVETNLSYEDPDLSWMDEDLDEEEDFDEYDLELGFDPYSGCYDYDC